MDKYSEENIISFLIEQIGSEKITSRTDIFSGLRGDDFHEMMDKYQKTFHVDMSCYLWYFHSDGEGRGFIGSSFFKPPCQRVERIPVTPRMLLDFANSGKWIINYPEHNLPQRRYDLIVNGILMIGCFIALIIYFVRK